MKPRHIFPVLLSLASALSACGPSQELPNSTLMAEASRVASLVKPNQDQQLAELLPADLKPYDKLIGFGDSLSDTGNLNRNTFGVFINKKVYWEGRWSNGPIWMEYLAGALRIDWQNYSVGAAETREKPLLNPQRAVIPGLGRQVDAFIKEYKGRNLDKTLIAMWIGSNNYLNEGNDKPEQSVKDIEINLQKLIKAGARSVLVGRVSDLSTVQGTSKTPEQLGALGLEHNRLLGLMLNRLRQTNPTVTLIDFASDVATADQTTRTEFYGFRDITSPCYRGDLRGNFEGEERFCDDVQGNRLWDTVHPNSKAQCYYAGRALYDLGLLASQDPAIAQCALLDPFLAQSR